jgi:intracellular septation protein
MASSMDLPHSKWKILNNVWGVYFIILGFINIAVAYYFSTEVWMNFKLFGIIGLTFIFLIAQSVYLSKHIKK